MVSFIATATFEGRLNWGTQYNEARLRQTLKEKVGRKFRLEEVKYVRSLSQNALYWMYLTVIQEETGNLASELHEYFKRALLPPRFIKVLGKEIKVPASTTELNKQDFGEYLEKISAETGIPIPDVKKFKDELDLAPTHEKTS